MDEAETDSKLSRKELRKQKLMTYLAAKGKLKPPNPKPYLRDDYPGKMSTVSNLPPACGKENQPVTAVKKHGSTNTVKAAKPALQTTGKVHARQSCTKGGILSASHGATNQLPKPSSTIAKPDVYQGTVKSCRSSAHHTVRDSNLTDHTRPCSMGTAHAGKSQRLVAQPKKATFPVGHQQRNVKSNPTQGHPAITAATTASNTNRVRSTSAPSAPKAPRGAVLPKPSQCRPTAVRVASSVSQNPPGGPGHTKPVPTASLLPGRPSAAGKQTLQSTRAMPLTGKPEPAQRAAKPAGPLQAGPGKRTADERPGVKRAGGVRRQVAAGSVTCAGTKSQRTGSKDGAGGPGTRPGGKGRVLQGNQGDAAKAPPRRATTSCLLEPPQTLPRCGPRVAKTPGLQGCRVPQTEGKKSTAAQQERMKKLQEWRDSKGISYKRPPMPVRPRARRTLALPQPYWDTMEQEDQAHSLISAVDRSLGDCIKLLAEGCLPEHVTGVLSRLPPLAKKFAKYWICQARLMERQGSLDVLPMFEEAVRFVLEPVDDLRTVVFDILKKRDKGQRAKERIEEEQDEEEIPPGASSIGPDAVVTPRPARAFIEGEKSLSSAVKYKITATPGGVRSAQRGRIRVDGQEVRFLTPVRRSVRIERASLGYPAFLREQDPCVASCEDLLAEEEVAALGGSEALQEAGTPMYVYRENEALGDQVKVRLLYDDE